MFNTYDEAREYARLRSRQESGYVGVIMSKDGKYNVARDYDEVEYAEKFGWKIEK